MKVFTIGYTEKSAEEFFRLLSGSQSRRLLDIRLNNTSQLAAFSKRDDLAYFCRTILGWDYHHLSVLAPTPDIFARYKKAKGDWLVFRAEYLELMEKRRVERELDRELLDQGTLLCSEHKPHHCHRSLVVEYLALHWGPMDVVHLY